MAIKSIRFHIILLLLLFAISSSFGQKRITLEPGAGKIQGFKKDGVSYTSIKDNVHFTHKGTHFYCDSAILAKKKSYLEAYGHVRILDGDSISIVASKLFYDGDTRVARMRSGVVLTQLGRMKLYTDFLDYDRNTSIANYFNNGKVVDTTNVLTSRKGYYNTRTNTASFKTDVLGKNEDYTMESDTLVYNTKTGIVYFVAPTKLTSTDGEVFNHEGGQYNSKAKKSAYVLGRVETEDYYLKGRDLRLDQARGLYNVSGNVLMISKGDDIFITGQQSIYNKRTSTTKIFDNALLRMLISEDTLYLKADTLISIDSRKRKEKRLLAYNNVQVFKSNIQSDADSLAYGVADSTMYFYGEPVLWTAGNQLTADSINMVIKNKAIDVLNMKNQAFVITNDSIGNHNQIKGREMVARFKNNELNIVDVYGNGESIFFMFDQETNEFVGMNKIICSDITLVFENKTLKDASFKISPEGDFIPPHELKEEDKTLRGFKWHEEIRPQLNMFIRPAIIVSPSPDIIEDQPINIEIEQPDKSISPKRKIPKSRLIKKKKKG
ncbi:MAG: OstA-like protein [Bacteroidota bacterium]